MRIRAAWLLLLCIGVAPGCSRKKGAATADAASAGADPIAQFWTWFSSDAAKLRTGDSQAAMGAINDHLASAGLTAIAEVENGDPWRLVISADGDKSRFPEVERVVASAPAMEGWKVIAFRQRNDLAHNSIEMNGYKVEVDDVRVVATRSGDVLDLQLYLPGYKDKDPVLEQIAFIILDNAVGEKDVETRIGAIELYAAEGAPADAKPVTDLPAMVDAMPR